MKFKLVENINSGLENESAMGVLDEGVLNEGKGGLTDLKWAFCHIVGIPPSSNISIHHIDHRPNNKNGGNITLIHPHTCSFQKAHAKIHSVPPNVASILGLAAGNDATIYFLSDYRVVGPTHYGPFNFKV